MVYLDSQVQKFQHIGLAPLILWAWRGRMSWAMVTWQRLSFTKDRKWGGTGQHKRHTLSYLCSPARPHLVQFPEPQKLYYCLETRQSTHKPVSWISFQIITRGLLLGESLLPVWYMHTYTSANSLLLGSVGSGKNCLMIVVTDNNEVQRKLDSNVYWIIYAENIVWWYKNIPIF